MGHLFEYLAREQAVHAWTHASAEEKNGGEADFAAGHSARSNGG
jgi:hypothetical protein